MASGPAQIPAEAATGSTSLHELAWTVGAVLLVQAFCLVGALCDPYFLWQDDFQGQYLPAAMEIGRTLSQGELPIFTDRAWFGAALAGELQHGVFSPSVLLSSWLAYVVDLSLPLRAAVLASFHLGVLAAGAFRLGRAYGLSPHRAMVVAVVAALNGFMLTWGKNWYPIITSSAWLPWFWWAVQRTRRQGVSSANLFALTASLYLVIAAGWPFAMMMVGLLTACLCVDWMLQARRVLAPWPLLAAWVLALGFAAPLLLTFLEYGKMTARAQTTGIQVDRQWMAPFAGLAGLVVPTVQAWWVVYGSGWAVRACGEFAGGLVPVCALLVALHRLGLRAFAGFRIALVVAGLALVQAMLPSIRPLQSSFRSLALFHVAFALAGAGCLQALDALRESSARRAQLTVPLVGAGLVAALTVFALGNGLDPTNITASHGRSLLLVTFAWLALEWAGRRYRVLREWAAVACSLAVIALWYSYARPSSDSPRWELPDSLLQLAPFDPQVRYLSLFAFEDLLEGVPATDTALAYTRGRSEELRIGYTGMYSGLKLVNGYSPMQPLGLADLLLMGPHGEITRGYAVHLLQNEASRGQLLDHMGVDGLVLVEALQGEIPGLESRGWRVVGHVQHGTLMHREGSPSPHVRAARDARRVEFSQDVIEAVRRRGNVPLPTLLHGVPEGAEQFAPATLGAVHEQRRRTRVQVEVPSGGPPALLVFARPWLPGWRAELDGQTLEVERVNALMPAVRVPAGAQGEVVLEYWPLGLERGLYIAGLTALSVLAVACARGLRRRRTSPAASRPSLAPAAPG